MNTDYTIKNFRVFDSKGATIPLRPITILTGCNSSGKSSIVKSMVLLDTFLKPLREDYENGREIDLTNYKLDFTTSTTFTLGDFQSILPYGSRNKKITFAYTVFSRLAYQELNVELTFVVDETIGQGKCESIVIKNNNGDIFYEAGAKLPKFSTKHIIDPFFRFALTEYEIVEYRHRLIDAQDSLNYSHDKSAYEKDKKRYEDTFKELVAIKEKYGSDFIRNTVLFINSRWVYPGGRDMNKSLAHKKSHGHPEIIETAAKWELLCYMPLIGRVAKRDKRDILNNNRSNLVG